MVDWPACAWFPSRLLRRSVLRWDFDIPHFFFFYARPRTKHPACCAKRFTAFSN
jgi:hypothetical protein